MSRVQLFGPDCDTGVDSYDGRVLENLFLVQGAQDARSTFLGKCTPGFGAAKLTIGTKKGRVGGLHTYRDRLFCVIGSSFYEVFSDFTYNLIGTLRTEEGKVSIASFPDQIMIVDGVTGYLYNDFTKAFGEITDGNFLPAPTQVISCDSYFICIFANTEVFGISTLNDGTTWPANFFVSAEMLPDYIEGIAVANRYVWFFGKESLEIRQDTGDLLPFNIVGGGDLQIGCAAGATIASSAAVVLSQPLQYGRHVVGGIFFLGVDGKGRRQAYVTKGLTVEIISDYNTDRLFSTYDIRDCYGFCYAMAGTTFYCITFPYENVTWCFDTTGATGWHRRTSLNSTDLYSTKSWRVRAAAYIFGKTIISDALTSSLYELSNSVFTENSTPIVRRFRSPISVGEDDQIGTISRLTLELDGNAGLATGQGVAPQAMLRMRMDRHWQKERWVTCTTSGDYLQRARWYRLGGAREWQAEIIMTDPIDWTLVGASAEINAGIMSRGQPKAS